MFTQPTAVQHVLLLDNDRDDCFVFENALKEINPEITLTAVHDASECMDALNAAPPDLLFLDLHLQPTSGLDVLSLLQEHPDFRKIPVVIYSSSDYVRDINGCYGLGATLYFVKPETVPKLVQSLRQILLLQWSKPGLITARQFAGGSYTAFQPS